MHFDQEYRERVEVGGGLRVIVRLLAPADREQLREGFYRLSETGRYQRFLSAKNRLSEAELDYLTEIDQVRHVALVAVADDPLAPGGEGPGLAVARFVPAPAAPLELLAHALALRRRRIAVAIAQLLAALRPGAPVAIALGDGGQRDRHEHGGERDGEQP